MNLDIIRYIGLVIGVLTFFSICRRFYLDWRTDKWHELTSISWDETYTTLENVLLAWTDTEIASHITDGDVDCGHFFIEVDKIKFKISLGKHPIKSWKEYRKYKKENSNTFYYLKTTPTLNTKSKIIARYETLEDFISEFPKIASLYVKQGKTEKRIDKLMEDF
jgi:hypothetical protein